MEGGLLSLKWNNHRSSFIQVLSALRGKEQYSDVTIACDGKFYSCHKIVLSTCSEYFEQMFDRTQCKHPVVVLKDVKSEDIEALLNYMYLGEVNVLQEKLTGLIKAAECLKIKGLAVPDELPPSGSSREKRSVAQDGASEGKRRRQDGEGRTGSKSASDSSSKYAGREAQLSAYSSHTPASKSGQDAHTESNRSHGVVSSGKSLDTLFPTEVINLEQNDMSCNVKEEPQDNYVEPEDTKNFLHTTVGLHSCAEGPPDGDDGDGVPGETGDYIPDSVDDLSQEPGGSGVTMKSWDGSNQSVGLPYVDYGEAGTSEEGGTGSGSQSDVWIQLSDARRTMVAPGAISSWKLFSKVEDACTFNKRLCWDPSLTVTPGADEFNKKLQCTQCSYKANDDSNMRRHQRIHTGERPYSCPHCEYRSSQSNNIKGHMKRYHPEEFSDYLKNNRRLTRDSS